MEGLAAASGVFAVTSQAGQILQGCAYLREVFDNAYNAPRDIRLIANELAIIENIVRDTPDTDLHQDELDFCNEKLSKLRKVVCKYGDLDSAGRYQRWGKRLAMAMSADKIHKHMIGLREARRYLEHIQNISSHDVALAKSKEVLESVRHLSHSQYEATQITSRTEGRVDEIHGITRETHKALHALSERFVHRDSVATTWSESSVERLIKAVEKIVEQRLEDHRYNRPSSKPQETCDQRPYTDKKLQQLLRPRLDDSMALVKAQQDHTYAHLGPRVIEVSDSTYSNYEVASWNQKDCPPLSSCMNKRSKYHTPMGKIFIRTHTVAYHSSHEMSSASPLHFPFKDTTIHPGHFPVTVTTTEVVLLPRDWHQAKGAVIKSQDVVSQFARTSDVKHEMKDFNRPPSPPFHLGHQEPQGSEGNAFIEQVVEKLALDVVQRLQRRAMCGETGPCYKEASFSWRFNSRPKLRKQFRRRRDSLTRAFAPSIAV